MEIPIHPLLALLECNATGLKSLLKHYIDATLDSQFASLRNSIETMIQSGQIGPLQSYNVTAFGTTLPPLIQTNSDQPGAESLIEYSNDQLSREQEHQNNLQNNVSLGNTINTNDDVPVIKQEFDHEEEDGEEIDDDSVAKCEKFENGICNTVHDNYHDNLETGENGDEHFETKLNVYAALENNQTTQLIISNDILPSPSPTNPINTEPLIKQECLQGSSITSIPLDFTNNAALNDISIDEQIEEQNIQIQTDEFDYNDEVDDYCEGGEDEYLNQPNCANEVCNLNHENNNNDNHLDDYLTDRDGDETDFEVNLDETQVDSSVANNTQMNMQNNVLNNEQLTPSTSGVLSSARKHVQTKVFGDLAQSNVNLHNSSKRKSYQANESVKLALSNRQFQCQHCDKSFDCNSNLQKHLRVHTGERPFHCDQCDKKFSQKGGLTRHQLHHLTIKLYRCKECAKRFTLKQHLDSHLLVHSGGRPFACRHCDQSFAQSITRTKHERAIHLHVKPYRCKQCGHTATERASVIKHIREVHFGLPRTIKQQRALNIIDDRDPKELVEKV